MRLRQYIPEQDSQEICEWANADERVFALWCANRFEYPLTPNSMNYHLNAEKDTIARFENEKGMIVSKL